MNASKPDRKSYIAGRYLEAFDAAQLHFGLSDEDMGFGMASRKKRHILIRRYMVSVMMRTDERCERLTLPEIGRAFGVSWDTIDSDVTYMRRHGVPESLLTVSQQRRITALEQRRTNLDRVVSLICLRLHIEVPQLASRGKGGSLTVARNLVCGLCRRHTGATHPEIAAATRRPGKYTSVVVNIRGFDAMLRDDPKRLVCGVEVGALVASLGREIEGIVGARKSEPA